MQKKVIFSIGLIVLLLSGLYLRNLLWTFVTAQVPDRDDVAIDLKTGVEFITTDVLVCFHPHINLSEIEKLIEVVEGNVVSQFKSGNCYKVQIPNDEDGSNVMSAIKELESMPEVTSASTNFLRHL